MGNARLAIPWLSWTQANGTSSANSLLLGGYPPDPPGRIGYQIGDEPLNLGELYQIQAGIEAVRAADPNALLIVNFSPDVEELDQMLEYFGENYRCRYCQL
jgi:hypothetical protein